VGYKEPKVHKVEHQDQEQQEPKVEVEQQEPKVLQLHRHKEPKEPKDQQDLHQIEG
jgi:hypothetical protein